ncbi:hypothetical protein LCGC14_1437940 [marine sediment metagenome]|uniref:Nucleotide-diphospho-sugar transferase domain-containing protein n=1 Tax=marine sediment metagenome TaxID=412755 RepID=A0A0F9JM47_9ZZZZ
MDFVWFYAKKFSFWDMSGHFNELDYSIRSVRKNYQGDVRCFVIGDKPTPMLDVIHLEAPPLIEKDEVHGQPRHFDRNNKFSVLLKSEVNEGFVLMWDDIFILKPTTKDEIMKTYGRCGVEYPEAYIKTRMGGTPYKKIWLSTYDYIKTFRDTKGLKTYDWETHLPRFMEKHKIKWLIDTLRLGNVAKLHTGLYSAHFGGETTIMPEGFQSDIYDHKAGMDFDKEFACHHMNIGDNAIVPELIDRMKAMFGE